MTTPSPDPSADDNPEVFRSRFNLVTSVVVWVFCAAAVVAVVAAGRTITLAYLGPIAFIAYLAWLCLLRPSVTVTDSGTRLVNILCTIDVPWEALIQVDTRFSLTLQTPHGRYTATAAPAPGRLNTMPGRQDAARGSVTVSGPLRPGDSPRTDSGAAAYLVRDRWHNLSETGRIELGVADSTPVARHWHWATVAIAAALLAGSLIWLSLS